MGSVELEFTVAEPVRLNFSGALVGTILGQLYLSEELGFVSGSVVSIPDGSSSVADVIVESVDFTDVDTLAQAALVEDLPEGEYTFLGALDVDDNGNDLGDPVTFSMQGSFIIEPGEVATYEVMFNGIQPF